MITIQDDAVAEQSLLAIDGHIYQQSLRLQTHDAFIPHIDNWMP